MALSPVLEVGLSPPSPPGPWRRGTALLTVARARTHRGLSRTWS